MSEIKSKKELFELFFNRRFGNNFAIIKRKYIYIFEEIDCDLLSNRKDENKSQNFLIIENKEDNNSKEIEDKIDLGDILNAMDGLLELQDSLIIFTTNHIEKLDEALIRPGRIDYKIKFTKMLKVDLLDMIEYYYKEEFVKKDFDFVKDYQFAPCKVEEFYKVSENYLEFVKNLKT